jgi:hypothetical protein
VRLSIPSIHHASKDSKKPGDGEPKPKRLKSGPKAEADGTNPNITLTELICFKKSDIWKVDLVQR